MRFLVVVTLAVAGLIIGFWLAHYLEASAYGAWEKLPSPPGVINELIPAGDPPLYVKTLDGATYRYEDWDNQGWVVQNVPEPLDYPIEIQEPCDLSAPEFSSPQKPPLAIETCLQEKVVYADGFVRHTFVLDKEGYLWRSSITRTVYDSLSSLMYVAGTGLLVGLAIGIIVAPHINKKGLALSSTSTAES